MLVALSSAMTMLIALELFEEVSARNGADPDPTRAIQGLAQAIGFLCAGVIFVAKGSVYGLTTAASLWMTSSLGMAAGAWMYQIAVAGVMFVAIATVHWSNGFFNPSGGYEFNLLIAANAIALAFTGPGEISIDDLAGWDLAGTEWGLAALGISAAAAASVLARRKPPLAQPQEEATKSRALPEHIPRCAVAVESHRKGPAYAGKGD